MMTQNTMRKLSMASLVISGYLAIAGLHMARSMYDLIPVIGMFIGGAYGGKYYQKKLETAPK